MFLPSTCQYAANPLLCLSACSHHHNDSNVFSPFYQELVVVLACEADTRSNQCCCPSSTFFCCEADMIRHRFQCCFSLLFAKNFGVKPACVPSADLTSTVPWGWLVSDFACLGVDRRRRGCSTCSSKATYFSTSGEMRRLPSGFRKVLKAHGHCG